MKRQSGFTLIELVVVIVILGILAATALPKFVDLSTEANTAAAAGVAGAISSASAINYAARQVSRTKGQAYVSFVPCKKETIELVTQPLSSNFTYAVDSTSPVSECFTVPAGTVVICSITPIGSGTKATASLVCTP